MTDARMARWQSLRYGRLLPWTARSRLAAEAYARLCAAVDYRLDPTRARAGVDRIGRWTGVDARRAGTIYRAALRSEAREEADVSWYMHHPGALADAFRVHGPEPAADGPVIWATLHLGSPNLAFVYLRRIRGVDVRIMARPLDDSNPMPASKRDWGRRKVGWLEEASGTAFLGTSPEDLAVARSRLTSGTGLYVLFDVPGDIAARSADVTLMGERVRIAGGIFVLAGLANVAIQPVVAVRRGAHVDVHYGRRIEPVGKRIPIAEVERELSAAIERWPDEWWLWPYLPPAP